MDEESKVVHNYFVDETGDLDLFGKRGQVRLGQDGVSNFFMVGFAHIVTPLEEVEAKTAELRQNLLSDPYFAGVPSMQPEKKKTALAFHASKDVPEVRYEFFKLLSSFEVKVKVIIRHKKALIQEAKSLFKKDGSKLKYKDIYYPTIQLLFRDTLSEVSSNEIIFAWLENVTRKEALQKAIKQAHRSSVHKKGSYRTPTTIIKSARPYDFAGLQVIDYYLWALQRLYEKQEDRFFNLLRQDYQLIIDLDDERYQGRGAYYSEYHQLTLGKLF